MDLFIIETELNIYFACKINKLYNNIYFFQIVHWDPTANFLYVYNIDIIVYFIT